MNAFGNYFWMLPPNSKDKIREIIVPYGAGELKAVGKRAGEAITSSIHTVGSVQAIQLVPDKDTIEIHPDRVVHVTLHLLDPQGHVITNQNVEVTFEVEGDCQIVRVDNGSPDNVQPYQSTSLVTDLGRGLLIVQGTTPGTLAIRAICSRIHAISNTCIVNVVE